VIFDFNEYRPFIKAYIANKPKRGFGEAKKMAEHLAVSSTFFSQVLSGLKQLSTEQANELSEYMGLSELESEYFFYLVSHDRAGTAKLKQFCKKKLNKLKESSLELSKRIEFKKTLSEEEKSIFYSDALYSAISLFTSTKEKGVTLEEIEKRFEIPRRKLTEMMRFFVQTGLCIESSGRYTMGTQSTHVANGSPHLIRHHTNWRLRALQAAENLDDKELMYTVNVSLSKKDFEKLREEMVQYIKSFLESVYPSPAEDIACFNLDWFWIRK
jgi:uncharacterized protein (TIGR02147 family)